MEQVKKLILRCKELYQETKDEAFTRIRYKKKNKKNTRKCDGNKATGSNRKDTNQTEGNKTTGSINRNRRVTFFLRSDMHSCYDYIHKLERFLIQIDGVEFAEGDPSSNKIKVIGKVNPLKIREMVELKTKKDVELIFRLPKEEFVGAKEGYKGKEEQWKNMARKGMKKFPVNTVFLKIRMHSDGCVERIQEIFANIDGVHEIIVDRWRNMVKVTGTVDVIELTNYLKHMLRKNVVVIQPEEDKGNDKTKQREGSRKWKEMGGGSNVEETKEATSKVEVNKMYEEYQSDEHGEYASLILAFSDGNSRGCTIM